MLSLKTTDVRIGSNMRRLRMRRRLLLMDLVEHLGLTYQQFKKYETGENRIAASALFRLALFLRFSLNNFFSAPAAADDRSKAKPAPENQAAAEGLERIEDAVIRDTVRMLVLAMGGPNKGEPTPFVNDDEA